MAIDIFNTDGGTTGIQRKGRNRVGYPGDNTISGRLGETYDPADSVLPTNTGTIVSITGKYDTKFDDPRYYQGDTSS